MRGEREIDCLNYVKKSFLNNLNILLYCDNKDKIRNIILNAKPNINSSQFPDFVFERKQKKVLNTIEIKVILKKRERSTKKIRK